jgi:VIT1/CCC1 family predicted Fe2+/Mn2+ transporter
MTGLDPAHDHDSHGEHPLPATLVLLILVAVFAAIFAAMSTKKIDTPVLIVAALMAGWGLVQIWVLDKD